MPLRHCTSANCDGPAVQKTGDCDLCEGHLCRLHLQDKWHKCPKPEEDWSGYCDHYVATERRQMERLASRLNSSEMCARASSLRNGIPCTVDLSTKALSKMMGGQNCHAEIVFHDDVRWIARFRLAKASSPPLEVRNYILKSEAATMLYLKMNTRIPSPAVYDWACEGDADNLVGLGYILMEKMNGRPLDWQAATISQKEKVMQQLVDIFLEIEKHSFEAVGSIVPQSTHPSGFEIQGIARHTTFRPGYGGPLGPFHCSIEAGRGIVHSYLQLIANGEVGGADPIDMYLVHRFRLELLDSMWGDPSSNKRFFLMHPDDKGNHIFVNESYEVTGIVDWEWTQSVSKELAFSSPCMMWPVADFYDGSNALSDDELRFADIFKERGRNDLADYVLAGRKVHRFFFFLGGDPLYSGRKSFLGLFTGLRRAFGFPDKEWDEWKAQALESYKDDTLLQALLQGENDMVISSAASPDGRAL